MYDSSCEIYPAAMSNQDLGIFLISVAVMILYVSLLVQLAASVENFWVVVMGIAIPLILIGSWLI